MRSDVGDKGFMGIKKSKICWNHKPLEWTWRWSLKSRM